jgi:hypothetical protein
MVLTAFDVGESATDFDLLIVDETHRLNQRANQPAAALNIKFRDITTKLFRRDDTSKTQLDWITAKSTHQIFLVDPAQSVKPADTPIAALERLVANAKAADHHHPLHSQMRVRAGSDYVGHCETDARCRARVTPATARIRPRLRRVRLPDARRRLRDARGDRAPRP